MADVLTKDQLFEHVGATVDKAVAEAVQEQIRKHQESQANVIPSWFQAFEQKQAAEKATKDGDHIGRMLRSIAAGKGDPDRAISMAKSWYDEPTFQSMKKTLTASSFTGGGATVPTAESSEIIEFLRAASVVRRLNPTTVPMPNGNLTISKMTGGATATYVSEAFSAVSSQPTFGQLNLSAKKLITIVPISNDLLRFANPQFDTMVRQDAIAAMAARQDLAFIRGDGTAATPKGLKFWTPAANVETVNAIPALATVTTDLGTLIGDLLNADVRMLRPAWIFAPRTYIYLTTLRDGNGNFAFRNEMLQGGMFNGTLWGYPYGVTTAIPINLAVTGTAESEIYFVDMADAIVADAYDMQVSVVDGAAYYNAAGTLTGGFSQDETVLKITSAHDFGMRHDESVAYFSDVDWV
jgi:HK97 family phage major capsid protein